MSIAAQPLSIVIMTYNEEENIGRCLQSVTGLGDEIFILDSFSTDGTVVLAKKMGARVEQFPFDTYADQRRRMIQMAKNDWTLILDADEYLSDELRTSIIALKNEFSFDAYTSNRKSKIGTTWLNHGSWYPDKKIRMFDRRKITVIGYDIHETLKPITSARIGHLHGDLLHLTDQNIESRFQKVQYYSTRAAEGLFRQGKSWSLWRILFKPGIRFISIYFIRMGILDGYYGYIVAKSESNYVWLREVKLWEMWMLKE